MCSVDEQIRQDHDVWLKDFQHREIVRSENDSALSGLTGTIVIRTTWPGIGRRSNEENMYRDCAGRFGTILHVCSYEAAGECREAISNILALSLPPEDDIERDHPPISINTPPNKTDTRTLRFTVFAGEGKSLVEAKSPRQLSRAWADFVLGLSFVALCIFSTDWV